MTPLDERDFITLNAYLDDELTASERAAFEQRLAAEPSLRQELEVLSTTINVLKLAERVRAPRNFTLDPKVYGKSTARSLMDRLGLFGLPQLVAAGGTLVAATICAAAIIFTMQSGNPAGSSAAEAPLADEATIAQMEAAEIAINDQAAEATEAPEEAGEAEAAGLVPPNPEAEESIPFEPLESPEPDLDGSGQGGAGGQGGGTGGQGGVSGTGPVIGVPITPSPTPDEFALDEEGSQRNTGTDNTESASQADDAQAEGSAETITAYASEPTDADTEQDTDLPAPSIPIIPITIGVLVLALGSGVLIARLARRR